ncbi:hypothetical protein ACFWPK_28285 [Nocardia sp. NPDC058519]|uniref:hypothetical protein n=1 Tax=Nocardia sp. NPDC058519 TaxID=3346535 RepID=UPI00365D884C
MDDKVNALAAAASTGNEFETLKVLRDQLAERFPQMSAGVVPQFAKAFMDLNARIAELDPNKSFEQPNNDKLRNDLDALLTDSEHEDSEPA